MRHTDDPAGRDACYDGLLLIEARKAAGEVTQDDHLMFFQILPRHGLKGSSLVGTWRSSRAGQASFGRYAGLWPPSHVCAPPMHRCSEPPSLPPPLERSEPTT